MFTFPAAVNVIYNAHIRHTPVAKNDKSVELAECVAFCFAVFLCNILVLHKSMSLFVQYCMLNTEEAVEFCKKTEFNYLDFMVSYFICNAVMSLLVIIVWYTLGQWLFRWLRNKLNKIRKRPEELKFSDVWSNVFETNQYIDTANCIVRIEKGNVLITAGVLSIYSPPNSSRKEFFLCDVDLVKQIFEDDVRLPLDYRMFKNSDYEYYDMQNDILIKFYNDKAYKKFYG